MSEYIYQWMLLTASFNTIVGQMAEILPAQSAVEGTWISNKSYNAVTKLVGAHRRSIYFTATSRSIIGVLAMQRSDWVTSFAGFLRRFRDPNRISDRVPRIRDDYHRVPKIRENWVPRIRNRVPRIREIGSLQIHTGYLTFSLKKTLVFRDVWVWRALSLGTT